MAWTASLTRECVLLARLLAADAQPVLHGTVMEAFSFPKSARRLPIENEDAMVQFSLNNLLFVGVFDGHGGPKLGRFMRDHIPTIAKEIHRSLCAFQEIPGNFPDDALVQAVSGLFPSSAGLEERLSGISDFPDPLVFFAWLILAVAEERALADPAVDTATAGGCVSLVLVDLARAMAGAAWLGDAAIVVLPDGDSLVPKFRSGDHRVACSPDERSRVEISGGKIFRNRAVGVEWSNLGVTRAFGDSLWKPGNLWSRDVSRGKSGKPILDEDLVLFSRSRGCTGISGSPDFAVFPLSQGDVLVVASDGLWDMRLQTRPPFRDLLTPVLHDDTTVVVLQLNQNS